MNQSCLSRFDTEYHEVLLIWDSCWPTACVAKVLSDLGLSDLETKAIYTSESAKRTMMHLGFDEEQPGFKKNYFASSQRRAGSNALRKCEVPSKWSKHLQAREIQNHLYAMF